VSTRNAKPSPPQAPADTPAQEAAASAAPVAAAVVQPQAPAAPVAPVDHHTGQGGLYTMKNGKRVLVHATQQEATKELQ